MTQLRNTAILLTALTMSNLLSAQETPATTPATEQTANSEQAAASEQAPPVETSESTSAAPAEATPASGFSAEVAEALGPMVDGKGKVVFFRPSRFTGAAIGFKVREGETELGKLRNAWFFVVDVAPGTHEYTVHSEAKDVTTLEVEAGEVYFLEGKVTMGFLTGRPNLSPSDVTAFETALDKLKPAKPLSDADQDSETEQ